ncbi:MAG: DUF190 domain-containing protein [Elusimicrobia bacterium]|nr:DUF190 domain-containing protein [Elusimicrobiota bacterium]
MNMPTAGKLLRIYIGEGDKWQGRPLYEEIVRRARDEGLAGATVLKGVTGYGLAHGQLGAKDGLPVVIEIVDSEEKIAGFLPRLDEPVREGLVTMEKVEVVMYRPSA